MRWYDLSFKKIPLAAALRIDCRRVRMEAETSWWWFSHCLVSNSCNAMDYSLPGFSVHGISQKRILEWVVISFSRGSSQPRDWTLVSRIANRLFTIWATREAPKKAEHQRINAFELWCWRRLLTVPWTTRRLNQSILREINPEYSLEGLMLKLKLQHFGHVLWTADSLEKSVMLGKIEDRRRRGHQRMRDVGWHHWCNGHELGQTSGDGEEQRGLACCSPWGCKESDMTGWLNNNNQGQRAKRRKEVAQVVVVD